MKYPPSRGGLHLSECHAGRVTSHQSFPSDHFRKDLSLHPGATWASPHPQACDISQAWPLSHLLGYGSPPQWNLPLLFHFPQNPLKRESYQKTSSQTLFSWFHSHWVNFSSSLPIMLQPRWQMCVSCQSLVSPPGSHSRAAVLQYSSRVCFQVTLGPVQSRVQGLHHISFNFCFCTSEFCLSLCKNCHAEVTGWNCKCYLNSLASVQEEKAFTKWSPSRSEM